MTPYVVTELAESDLIEIASYIAEDNLAAAERVLSDFKAAFEKLAQMPEIGHHRIDLADEELRFWPVHSYLVIYRPETKPLQVVRVLSGYRDIPELLR